MNSTHQQAASENTHENYERCVLCGKVTLIPKDMHLDLRAGYVEGCGQLCRECFSELYGNGRSSPTTSYSRF